LVRAQGCQFTDAFAAAAQELGFVPPLHRSFTGQAALAIELGVTTPGANRVQQAARPLLVPLFEGAEHTIDADAQSKIAAWIAMATMTGEHLSQDEKRIAVPQADRIWLMAHSTAPPSWCIWVGRYRWQRATPQWVHVSIHVPNTDTLPDRVTEEQLRPNTQTTAFCVGEMSAFVMSSEFPEIPPGWDSRTAPSANFKLHRIWPIQQPVIQWSPAAMTDLEAQAYPVAFAHYMDDLAPPDLHHTAENTL
jgi:hypothetical protein